jgi:hypothetical protein
LAGCQYKPAKLDGTPVAAWFEMDYNWTLDLQ